MKKRQFLTHKINTERFSWTFLIGVMVLLMVILIPNVSAFEFDNVINEKSDKTIDIVNAFGFGATIARATLLTPNPNYVIVGENRNVMVWEIENYDDDYLNAISKFTIKNMETDKNEVKLYHYEYAVYEYYDKPIYKQTCKETLAINGTAWDKCTTSISSYEDARRIIDWRKLDNNIIPKGNITIALVTNVNKGDSYDGIPTIMGVNINQWAVWTDGLDVSLLGYWNLDETAGVVGEDSLNGTHNMTWFAAPTAWKAGVIDNSVYTAGVNFGNVSLNNYNGAQSWSIWFNSTNTNNNRLLMSSVEANNGVMLYQNNNLLKVQVYNGGVTLAAGATDDAINYHVWNHVVLTFDGINDWNIYINGTAQVLTADTGAMGLTTGNMSFGMRVGMIFFIGMYDEIGYWGRELSGAEATQLYNEGTGITYRGPTPITITTNLNAPTNATSTLNSTITFDGSFEVVNGNFTNTTLYLVNSTSDIITGGNDSFEGIINATNITYGHLSPDTYLWNFYTCASNFTGYSCEYGDDNYTLIITRFTENSQTFNTTTVENSVQAYTLNVTYNNSIYTLVSATLDYNGTDYQGTKIDSTPDTIFTRTLSTPTFETEQNVSFKWKLTMTSADGTFYVNSTSRGQLITITNMSIWGRPYITPYLNFTVYEEETLDEINVSMASSFMYGATAAVKNFSYEDDTGFNSTFDYSINTSDRNYYVSGVLTYARDGYTTRTYELQEQSFSNVTTSISLYILNSTDSTSFIVYVRDSSFTEVEGAYVYIQRYYPGLADWKTIEIIKTNYDGKSIGHFKAEDVNYRFLVYVDGVLELTSTSTKVFCEATPCTITLTLPADAGSALTYNVSSLDFSLTYSKVTTTITYSYEDTSAEADGGFLIVKKVDFGNATTPIVCDTSSGSSAAILTCDLTPLNNGTYYAYAYNNRTSDDTLLIEILSATKTRSIVKSVGLEGVLWAVFLMIGIVMVGLYSPPIAIVFLLISVILISWLQIISIPLISIISLILIGGLIVWQLKK